MIVKKILGPPGTGKTEKLISMLDEYLAQGIAPDQVAFVSFTKRAADNAKERVMKRFKYTEKQLPWFRTLHSFAFQFLGMQTTSVMGWHDYQAICREIYVTISSVKMTPEEFMNHQQTTGDRLFFLENLARATKSTLKKIHADHPNEDISIDDLEQLALTLLHYKEVQGKVDFTDMITKFIAGGVSPKLKVLILDEAQDLQPIQWDMIAIMKKFISIAFILAGDDDQAIYEWAGADVKQFQNYDGEVEVLAQSYRIPTSVHMLSKRITDKIKVRKIKRFLPMQHPGNVIHTNEIDTLEMRYGTWLLLARNIYMLGDFDRLCIERGYYYESRFGSAVDQTIGRAIITWENLRVGKTVSTGEVKHLYEYLGTKKKVKWGFKDQLERMPDDMPMDILKLQAEYGLIGATANEPWYDAFNKARERDIAYFRTILRNGEEIEKEPRIKINTIHGVKGAEADNVVVMTDMSARTFEHFQFNPDAEARVWYVAVTRAKDKLYIIHPRTQYFFPL